MLYLLLAIVAGSAINLGFALVKRRGCDNMHVTWVNYLTATTGACVLTLLTNLPAARLNLAAALENTRGVLTPDGSLTVTLLLGTVTGLLYPAILLITQHSIFRNGPSPTTMFNKLGVTIPILLSIVLWNETPTAVRWVGIVFSLGALVIFNWDGGLRINGLLLLTFAGGGVAELTHKLFAVWCGEAFKPLFLAIVFGISVVICTLLLARRGFRRVTGQEWLIGVGIGLSNLSSVFFVIQSLVTLPSSVVFPALCAGVILLIALMGRLFFGERLGKRGFAAICMTVIGLVLVNL